MIASSAIGWGCQQTVEPAQPDAGADASASGDAGTDGPDAQEADATNPPGSDATLPDDSAAGDGDVDAAAAPDDAGRLDATGSDSAALDASSPDAQPADTVDAGCSAATESLAVTSSAGGALANPFVVRATCVGSAGTTIDNAPVPNGFTLTNTSAIPVTWTAALASGSSAYFSLDKTGGSLAAGASVTVTVAAVALSTYPPGETVTDAVVVTESAPTACAHTVPVREAFEGYFFTPATLNFGDVAVGKSAQLHVTATFTGGQDIAGVLSASPAPEFQGSVQAGPNPITGLDVDFTPAAVGPTSGTVSFTGFMSPFCTAPIAATGTGTPPPAPACASLDGGTPCGTGGVCLGATCTTQLGVTGISFPFRIGGAVTPTLGHLTDALVGDTAGSLSATIAWGDGSSSEGAITGATGAFNVAGTHTYTTATIVSGTVTVTDGSTGNSASATFAAGPAIAVKPFTVTGSLAGIAAGTDGSLWFPGSSQISEMTTAGVVTSFDDFAVDARSDLSATRDITLGPDGNLWFAASAKVGRSSSAGANTAFVPTGTPGAFTAGPDGNVWFTEPAANQIGRVTPAGVITEFVVPTSGASPAGIATGSDGNLWFTEFDRAKIGQVTPAGVFTEFALSAGVEPQNIVGGPDGSLWFTDGLSGSLSRITPTGTVTKFAIPGSSLGSAVGLAVGPDGNLWVTSGVAHQLSRITTSGTVSVYFAPGSAYGAITAGTDGNLWATDALADQIVRITPPSP